MTVPSTKNVKTHVGNGVTTVFPFDFRIFEAEDLEVSLTLADGTIEEWVLGTDFTVPAKWEDVQAGGEIIATTAPASGTTLVIKRVLDLLQQTDLRNQGDFLAEVIEDQFDRFAMQDQQLAEVQGRTLQRPLSGGGWNALGYPIKNLGAPVDPNDAVRKSDLSAFATGVIQPLVDEAEDYRDQSVQSAGQAAGSATTASNAATTATNKLTEFQGQYYGAYASDPTEDPNGNPPDEGDLYWNTTAKQWRVWNGTAWQQPDTAVPVNYDRRDYIATAGQTVFEVAYDAPFVQVWVNGLLLPPEDYVASTGTEVVLNEGVVAGTEVTVVGLGSVVVGNDATVTTSTGTQLLPAALDKRVVHVPDLPALRALTGLEDGQKIELDGQIFSYTSSDLSAEVANDPNEQIYIPITAGGTAVKESGVISDTVTIDVGGAGAFSTIGEAISFLTKFRPAYKKDGAIATINLLSGFSASEQLNFVGIDLSWIKITSDDAEVAIVRSALTEKIGRWYPFIRCQEGKTPQIHTLFSMDTSGTASERTALYLIAAECFCEAGAGFKNSGERNADITQLSLLRAPYGVFSGSGTVNVRPSSGSTVFIQSADLSDAGTIGLSVGSGAVASAQGIDATGSSYIAVSVQGGCSAEIPGADLSGASFAGLICENKCQVNAKDVVISGPGSYGIYASNGAVINAKGCNISSAGDGAGILSESGAVVSCENGSVVDCPTNLLARLGGAIYGSLGTYTGGAVYGLRAHYGGKIVANISAFKRGASPSPYDASVYRDGIIHANDSTDSGGVSQSPNITTNSGIIYTNDVVRSFGSATVPSGSTSVVVSHGLDVTPFNVEITVTPTSAMGNASHWWVSAVGATTFTINTDSDPTGGGASFVWRAEKIA